MAFTRENLGTDTGQAGQAFSMFTYKTDDDRATVVTDNYFSDVYNSFRVGDFIFVSGATETYYIVCSSKNSGTKTISFEYVNVAPDLVADFIDLTTGLDNPDYKEGRMFYDDVKKALSYYNDVLGITINMGQEVVFPVWNNTGGTISNGKIVYPAGLDVPSGLPTFGLADASKKDKSRFVGMVTADIPNNSRGYVTRLGSVGGLNTSGLSGVVYLSTDGSGDPTMTKPDDGAYLTPIGAVGVVSATEGTIIVDPKISELTVEVTDTNGFPPDQRIGTTLSVVNGTRTFTITPDGADFHFYELGDKYEIVGADSVVFTDQEGEHWLYYEDGVLIAEHEPSTTKKRSIILNNAFVATIYWNATDKEVEVDILDERHGISMSPATHLNLHLTRGAQFIAGFGLGDIISDGSGNNDSSAQFSVSAGLFSDEDLEHIGLTIPAPATLKVAYNLGVTSDIRTDSETDFAVLFAPAGRLYYNQNDGGDWKLTEVTNNKFCLYHIFAVNGQDEKVLSVMGQNEYASFADARTGASTEISSLISQLPFVEFVPLATVIYQTADSYTNAPKSRIISDGDGNDYIDWRTTELASGSTPSSHSNLTNVDNANTGIIQGHVNNNYPLQTPELTTVQRDLITPNAGMTIWNTTDEEYQIYDGTSWIKSDGSGGSDTTIIRGGVANNVENQYTPVNAPVYDSADNSYEFNGTTQYCSYSLGGNSLGSLDFDFYTEIEMDSISNSPLIGPQSDTEESVIFIINTIGVMALALSSNGNSFDIVNNAQGTKNDWSTGTKYQFHLYNDGANWKADWSDDGKDWDDPTKTWNNEITVASTGLIFTPTDDTLLIGGDFYATDDFLDGKFYLSNTTLIVGGVSILEAQMLDFTSAVNVSAVTAVGNDGLEQLSVAQTYLDITDDADYASGSVPTLTSVPLPIWIEYNGGTNRYIYDDILGSNLDDVSKSRLSDFGMTDSSGDIIPNFNKGGTGNALIKEQALVTYTPASQASYTDLTLAVPPNTTAIIRARNVVINGSSLSTFQIKDKVLGNVHELNSKQSDTSRSFDINDSFEIKVDENSQIQYLSTNGTTQYIYLYGYREDR